ncbi:hypothetical protein ACWGIN_05970 [Streptomyces sp. NPDC054861]
MGIESDQLVFDYLSRVGDLAQQRQLPSASRMRLVSSLRNEIDRRRATGGEGDPGAVRGILAALGTPDEIVERATGSAPGRQGTEPSGTTRDTPGARKAAPSGKARAVPKPRGEERWPTPPHLAGTDEVGSSDTEPDWWSTEAPTALPGDELVPGFRGGVEIPELLKPPVDDEADEDAGTDGTEAPAAAPSGRRRLLLLARPWRRAPVAPVVEAADPAAEATGPALAGGRLRLGSPVLVLAALLLLGGAVFGSLVALAGGWLLAYASRRLSRAETQWAVVVLPALALTAGAVWIWGRVEGRWGVPIAQGGEAMGAALSETWPWVLRGAAIASCLFLLWRARRH